MDEKQIKAAVLDAFEVSLDAQLRAIRRLKQDKVNAKVGRARKGMSQVDMAYDILQRAEEPLHISDILDRIARVHGQRLDRESLVSALVKKVQRQDRFTRTGKNIFALLKGGQ
jgi:DNA-directed RNA polymerase delta subunit